MMFRRQFAANAGLSELAPDGANKRVRRPPERASGSVSMLRDLAKAAADLRRTLAGVSDPYRPELHYMRGPGPKWRAKRAGAEVSATGSELPHGSEVRA